MGCLFGEGCTVSSTALVVVAILRQEGQEGAERSHCSKQEIMIGPVYKVFASVCGMTKIPCINKEAEVCSLEVH